MNPNPSSTGVPPLMQLIATSSRILLLLHGLGTPLTQLKRVTVSWEPSQGSHNRSSTLLIKVI